MANNGKTIEQRYQKKTQHEHILLRLDTYVGSLEKTLQWFWVLNPAENQFLFTELEFVPALYKIFDEIIVNAADNNARDSPMTYVKVEINEELGSISVINDGKGTNFFFFLALPKGLICLADFFPKKIFVVNEKF
jgi:DNA topoisomerase-2